MISGIIPLAIAIFAFFSIYWGAVWKSPVHTLPGWIIVGLRLSMFSKYPILKPHEGL
jgi:hypothetical protein